MSHPTSGNLARVRFPRLQDPAAVRSRLALVQPVRSRARRTPFVALVALVLVAGVVGLLLFNTQMQQGSFETSALQEKAQALTAQQQSLDMQLQQLRDPQYLAQRAVDLGMVVPPDPAFVRLSDGKVLGTPTVTTVDDRMRVRGYPAAKPAALAPAPRIVHVTATPKPVTGPAKTSASTGPASTTTAATQGRKSLQEKKPLPSKASQQRTTGTARASTPTD
jgi:cell division protein FtsB